MLVVSEVEARAQRRQNVDRIFDGALLAAASVLAGSRGGGLDWRTTLGLFVPALALWLFAARALHQYDSANGRGFVGDIVLTLVLLFATLGPIWLIPIVLPGVTPPWSLRTFSLLTALGMLSVRVQLVALPLWKARPPTEVLVVGIGPLGRLTGREIDGRADRHLVGFLRFEDEPPHLRLRQPLLGTADALGATLRERIVDSVYFASTSAGHTASVQEGIQICEELGVPFALPAYAYRLARARPTATPATADGYTHFLSVRSRPFQSAVKRLFDIVASGAALMLLSPLLLLTALAVRATSPGGTLFRQQRVGLSGRTFNMLKFRSMVANADALKDTLLAVNEQTGPVFKMKRDPRVTAVGRFIRKYSIDELPQLLNVLRGEMSIVGPRPPLPSEVARYEPWQRRRLSVRPGLTCVWQVSGRNEISFRDWMLLDLRYIDHWNLAHDFDLIWRTVPVVFSGRGAS
jgi:exopolysaccharide biosynthesis polyprenyl glycosylphosphotransferase